MALIKTTAVATTHSRIKVLLLLLQVYSSVLSHQVYAAVRMEQPSSRPALLTVPSMVMGWPPRRDSASAESTLPNVNAGLLVLELKTAATCKLRLLLLHLLRRHGSRLLHLLIAGLVHTTPAIKGLARKRGKHVLLLCMQQQHQALTPAAAATPRMHELADNRTYN
jgi:hypothetical protein